MVLASRLFVLHISSIRTVSRVAKYFELDDSVGHCMPLMGPNEFLVSRRPTDLPRLGGARRHGLLTWYSHGSAQGRRVVKTFTDLTWSSDGSTLTFSSDMDETSVFYVYTIAAKGGDPPHLDLTRSASSQQIMWRTVWE